MLHENQRKIKRTPPLFLHPILVSGMIEMKGNTTAAAEQLTNKHN